MALTWTDNKVGLVCELPFRQVSVLTEWTPTESFMHRLTNYQVSLLSGQTDRWARYLDKTNEWACYLDKLTSVLAI